MRKDRSAIMQLFGVVNRLNADTSLDKHAGGWRLQTADGANISPRLDTTEFYWWMYGYETGLQTKRTAEAEV
jgi:hypothetical protein